MERATLVITGTSSNILPEITKIISDMVALYNSEEFDDKLLLKLTSDQVDGSVVRYQSFESRNELLTAIIANCPIGIDILPIYE